MIRNIGRRRVGSGNCTGEKRKMERERERYIYKIDATRKPRLRGAAISRIKRDMAWLIARHPGHTRRSSRVTPSFALSGKLPFRDAVASGAAYTRVLFRKQKGVSLPGIKRFGPPPSPRSQCLQVEGRSDSNFFWNFLARIER